MRTSAKFIDPTLLLRTEKLPAGNQRLYKIKLDGYADSQSNAAARPSSVRATITISKYDMPELGSKGIHCLYLATDEDTAMSEVRPWLKARISIARLPIPSGWSGTRTMLARETPLGDMCSVPPDLLEATFGRR